MSCARTSVVVLLMLGFLGFASASPPQFTQWHSSPDTGLEYLFDTTSGLRDDRLTAFAIPMSSGTLFGSISEGEDRAASELWLDGSRERVTATIQVAPGSDVHQVKLDYGDFGSMFYEWNEAERTWTLITHTVPDCDALRDSAIYRAVLEAWERITHDFEISTRPAAPHQEQIWQILTVSAKPPRLVEDCRGFVVPNTPIACGAENPDYAGCAACCDQEYAIAGICMIGFQFCPTRWCRKAEAAACGMIWKFEAGFCRRTACRGKPGDPGCPASGKPDCMTAGGSCRVFCSVGECSLCGACDSSFPACCGPC
jgi:hypothetical protein